MFFYVAAVLFLAANFAELCLSYEQNKPAAGNHGGIKHKEVVVHGILFWASMGFLIPCGILAMRMSTSFNFRPSNHKIFFYLHASMQVVSVVVLTIGAIQSSIEFENEFNNLHKRMGLALYAAIYLQIVSGFIRPQRRGNNIGRRAWYFLHWFLGTATCMMGILNIYTGLQEYHNKTSTKDTALWTKLFSAQLLVMIIVFLFQDHWRYIQNQGLMMMGPHHAGDLKEGASSVEE